MKKKIALIAALFLALGSTGANAAATIKIYPQYKIDHKTNLVTFKITGLPTTHGIYIQQCMAPDKGKAPTVCNPNAATKLWVSNVAADIAQGAKSAKSKITMKIDPYFKHGDCIHTTCVFSMSSDHNAPTDRSEDQVIPFKYS